MQIYQAFVLALGFLTQAQSTRITMDEKAQSLCKKYKMMCKIGKVCAVQHFDWPKNITIPVCIPLSFVPVRNLICQLPPETGRCSARYIRWYYNMHSQECSHFQYGGCNGNQNNFMSKVDCEQSCLSTPSISLYEGGQSALSQMKPSILTAPIYEPPKKTNKYEALNSVMIPGSDSKSDRYQIRRHRTNRIRTDESNTRKRRRLDKERAKERRRKERRKEKKRQRRLRQERKRKHGKRGKKDRRGRKKKKKTAVVETINETSLEKTVDDKQTDVVVEDAKPVISNEIDDDDDSRKEKRKERKRKKRREKLRKKRRLEREGRRSTNDKRRRYAELVRRPETVVSHKLFSILDQ